MKIFQSQGRPSNPPLKSNTYVERHENKLDKRSRKHSEIPFQGLLRYVHIQDTSVIILMRVSEEREREKGIT